MHRHSQMQLQPRMRAQLILDSLMPLSLSLCHHVSFFLGFNSKLQLLRLILLQKFMYIFHQCVTLCREPFLIAASEVLLKHLLISERVAWQVLKSPPSDHCGYHNCHGLRLLFWRKYPHPAMPDRCFFSSFWSFSHLSSFSLLSGDSHRQSSPRII